MAASGRPQRRLRCWSRLWRSGGRSRTLRSLGIPPMHWPACAGPDRLPWTKRMSLIEHLEPDDWKEVLRRNFEYALDVLKNDRFRTVSSSVDDLRSWLAAGGVSRVREHLNDQMETRRFPEAKRATVNDFLDELVRDNRARLLDLMAQEILAPTKQEWLSACGFSELDFEGLWSRILAGERPFEDWMHAHGRSDEEITAVYRLIDEWLMRQGVIHPPEFGTTLH